MPNCNHEPRIHQAVYKFTMTQPGEELPAYAWPGGYPIFYLDTENNTLCNECATKVEEYSACIVTAAVEEDSTAHLQCDDCQKIIQEGEESEDGENSE